MVRLGLVLLFILLTSGCASMFDGEERLGYENSTVHEMEQKKVEEILADKTYMSFGRDTKVQYLSPSKKLYLWTDSSDQILVTNWSVERSEFRPRFWVCITHQGNGPLKWYQSRQWRLFGFTLVEENNEITKECIDYSDFTAFRGLHENTDIFNLTSMEKPAVDIENWFGLNRTLKELKVMIEEQKKQ